MDITDGKDLLRRAHYLFFDYEEAHAEHPCGLCRYDDDISPGLVCQKCFTTVSRMTNEAKWALLTRFDEARKQLFWKTFQIGRVKEKARITANPATGIGERIDLKRKRNQIGKTQAEVAEILGVSREFISQVETGKRSLPRGRFKRLSQLEKCKQKVPHE